MDARVNANGTATGPAPPGGAQHAGTRAPGLFRARVVEARRQRLWGDLLLTRPPGTAAALALVLMFLAALAALLGFGEFTRTERVAGYLVPEGGVIGVQTPQPGLVARVLVREGDRVRAGQRLVEIRDARVLAGGEQAADAALATIDARLARLAGLRGTELDRLDRERGADEAAVGRLQARARLLEDRIDRAGRELALVRRAESRFGALVRTGHVAAQQAEAATRERLGLEREIEQLEGARLQLDAERAALAARLDGWADRRAARLAELDDRRDALERERVELGGTSGFWLQAPRGGRVASLAVVAGEMARPGRDLLTLLEPDASMTAVLLVPSRAAGFVRAGQAVRLRYDAFPYTRFGQYPARVVGVGRSILSPAELTGPARATEPVYKVRVRPEEDRVHAYGESVPLRPGMSLQADIELEHRRLWRWLLDPLLALGASL